MELIAIIVGLALLEYLFFVVQVGKARGQFGIEAPSVTGNEQFERIYRVQQNTLEQLIVFIPALILFAVYVQSYAGAIIGLVFIFGRFLYYNSYMADPAKRGPGMLLCFIVNVILVLGVIIGAGWAGLH